MPNLGDSPWLPWLIVGLGNPGQKYENTRHNVGFDVIDVMSTRWKAGAFTEKRESLFTTLDCDKINGTPGKVFLIKPQTYMNLSGRSVRQWKDFFKVDIATHLLIIVDDLDLPPGQLRLRPSGSAGGHNGLKSLIEELGTDAFPRLRIGIGRDPREAAVSFVLKKFNGDEKKIFAEAVTRAAEGVELCLKLGVLAAMNSVNQKIKGTE